MDVAGSAVGIASLGIQVCQGLISYYDSWKGYEKDISIAQQSITQLCTDFTLLQDFLSSAELDPAKATQVGRALELCVDGLTKLQKKLHKLCSHTLPSGYQQKVWVEMQRSFYPFRASTLAKLREIVNDLQSRLSLALQILHLDLSANSQQRITRVETYVKDTAATVQDLFAVQHADQFRKIVDWLSLPSVRIYHDAARRHHEPYTGTWLLQSRQYAQWKGGHVKHLWLHGKAGCGKTVLCSTVIDNVESSCMQATNDGFAMFYFTFSDSHNQSYTDLLRSVVAQLVRPEHGYTALLRAYENRSLPGAEILEDILVSIVIEYHEVYLILDALDECREDDEVRRTMLDGLQRLVHRLSNLRTFTTSRHLLDVDFALELIGASPLSVDTYNVDADISKYVASELSHDQKLLRLPDHTKTMIQATFARKADGMFRWAFCQLQELKKLRSMKPKYVKQALLTLPLTLDATYERMLTGIEEIYSADALTLLRWLSFQARPLTLAEVAEATIITPFGGGTVDFENRGAIEDVLEILRGLVTVERSTVKDQSSEWNSTTQAISALDGDNPAVAAEQRISKSSEVKLAHYSVKEFLESSRILESTAKVYHLAGPREHHFLAQSCLTYLLDHADNDARSSMRTKNLDAFPLLDYAAQSWFHHSTLQEPVEVSREVRLLTGGRQKLNWLSIYQPDRRDGSYGPYIEEEGTGLYYAALLGLEAVVLKIVATGVDVNARSGYYGSALQAACAGGHVATAEVLIDNHADVNAQGLWYYNALQLAAWRGHDSLAEVLINKGANVNAEGGEFGSALQAACLRGHEKLARMLLGYGADVNACGGEFGNALQAAAWRGYMEIAGMLIEHGADVNSKGGRYGSASQAALRGGHEELAAMLSKKGYVLDSPHFETGYALQIPSYNSPELQISRGATVGAQVYPQWQSSEQITRRAHTAINRGIGAKRARPRFEQTESQKRLESSLHNKRLLTSDFDASDFKMCEEPWSLSSILEWLRHLQSYNSEYRSENDLKALLLALFLNKVPTMNIGDAAQLTNQIMVEFEQVGAFDKVVGSDYIRIVPAHVRGVILQLTGSGCYSPLLHNSALRGRCYSYHCGRTVKP